MKCMNCTKRKVGCHATCPDYLEYRKKQDKLIRVKAREKQVTQGILDRQRKNILRNR